MGTINFKVEHKSFIKVAASLLFLSGCHGMADYRAAAEGKVAVDPDEFSVNSSQYPSFKIVQPAIPPKTVGVEMVAIAPSDRWRVTHKVGESYLIFSDTYQARQCNHDRELHNYRAPGAPDSGNCEDDYLYHVYVDVEGDIARPRGWLLLDNPQRVVLSSDRRVIMEPEIYDGELWKEEILFREDRVK